VNGHVSGFEFEGRKNFGFLTPHAGPLSPYLRYLSLTTNVTYATSQVFSPNVEIPGVGPTAVTNTRRALQGQAPFIVNSALEYNHPIWGNFRLSYNTIGPYIVLVGTQGVPDVSQLRHQQLDFSLSEPLQHWTGWPVTVSLNIENILNQPVNWSVGQQLGTTGSSPIFRSPGVQNGVYQRYSTGVAFTLGVSYSF
jgi:hypothetical protein